MEFPNNLLETISSDNHYEIYKFIHQTNNVDMSVLPHYTIYNHISNLSKDPSFIYYVNHTCSTQQIVDCMIDLSIYHHPDLVDIHIVSTFSEQTSINILTHNTNIINNHILTIIISKLINSNTFVQSLLTCSINRYCFLQSYQSITSIILYLKHIYKFYYNKLICLHLFKKNHIELKDTVEHISFHYYKHSNYIFLSNLKNMIHILTSRFHLDNLYYMKEKQYREEILECQNQLGLKNIEEPFQIFKASYARYASYAPSYASYTIDNRPTTTCLSNNKTINLQDLQQFVNIINSYRTSAEH